MGRSSRLLAFTPPPASGMLNGTVPPVPVRDDIESGFFEEVGRLVVAFGRLEYLVKLCVKALVGQRSTHGMA